jgi:hypothetical protein
VDDDPARARVEDEEIRREVRGWQRGDTRRDLTRHPERERAPEGVEEDLVPVLILGRDVADRQAMHAGVRSIERRVFAPPPHRRRPAAEGE